MKFSVGAGQMVSGALDANGDFFPLDSLQQTINKDTSGNVTSIVATNGANFWTQSYTYSANTVVISMWVKS